MKGGTQMSEDRAAYGDYKGHADIEQMINDSLLSLTKIGLILDYIKADGIISETQRDDIRNHTALIQKKLEFIQGLAQREKS
jgi:hypothetical protein